MILELNLQNSEKNSNFILKIKELKDEFITGILLANNVFNILATALMTELLVSEFGGFGVTVATIFMTIMIVIFSEVTPKIFAINRPMLYALKVARFFLVIYIVNSSKIKQNVVRGEGSKKTKNWLVSIVNDSYNLLI